MVSIVASKQGLVSGRIRNGIFLGVAAVLVSGIIRHGIFLGVAKVTSIP